MRHPSILLLLLFLTASCGNEPPVRVLKLGHGLDVSHPVHKAMIYMAERVDEKSGGKMRIDIYPSQQLGSERETLELLQIGSLDITKVSSSVLEGFEPVFKIFSVPFLFANDEHRFRVMDGPVGEALLQAGENIRLHGLTYYDAGTRSFYTKDRPIHHPDDLKGLKIRVQESVGARQMVNTLGGSATPMSIGELYTSLQQGIVDGAENNPPSFLTTRHYEVSNYYSMTEHTAVPDILFISLYTWNRLTEDERVIIHEAARESALFQRDLWAKSTLEAMETVAAAGVEIIHPVKTPFAEILQPLYELYSNEDPRLREYIRQIRELEGDYAQMD